jgi:hypothetical protein
MEHSGLTSPRIHSACTLSACLSYVSARLFDIQQTHFHPFVLATVDEKYGISVTYYVLFILLAVMHFICGRGGINTLAGHAKSDILPRAQHNHTPSLRNHLYLKVPRTSSALDFNRCFAK